VRDLLTTVQDKTMPSTAVVLTSNGLLMPVLHHLPAKDVNISMGYPLARSPLNRLLDSLLQMQLKCSQEGFHYWRDALQALRHPYLTRLTVEDEQGHTYPLRGALRKLESLIRSRGRYVDMAALGQECAASLEEPLRGLFLNCLDVMVHQPAMARTTAAMAVCLTDICEFLLRYGGEMWRQFPLDAEAMFRLMRHVTPILRTTLLAEIPFPPAELHTIVREILAQERVPFEADPLTGLQVLGMLETRLLHFDRVLILDATDDNLPGNPSQDPLMPDSLRLVLGLPDARRRERTMAHTLYRLCAGAREVHFFWQEGVSRSALFDGKKSRSRFVEELIWQEEQRRGALLKPGEGPLQATQCVVNSFTVEAKSIARTPALDKAIRTLLQKPLSASRLDVYLQCPLAFALRYLCRINAPQEVCEGDDPAAVGICLHDTLRLLYEPWIHREVHRGDIGIKEIRACFARVMETADLQRLLPADSCLMLESSAPLRLLNFLQAQPETTTILALEEKIE
ncbi:MAG: PD-(D/E)XK nuclease family protein, partial [Desulfovibrionaceae bacterium]|nr:PD-(D/E)XK nuclease family protein [Desulfovibrionaceae bacterium]